ncbi:hypothetical protein [Sulfitobacter sp. MF3-043]|uniref:hypothetical protein n=1 Tax=Sulfitobacter sediminivivens TaxID=3252902 RepID=UPI0036DE5503
MSALGLYNTINSVSSIIKNLEEAGMRVEIGDDFAAYRRIRNLQKDRSGLYPMFDVTCSYVDQSNAFWVCGFNETDELVHTQAIRQLDLSGVTLGQHMDMHRHKYMTPNSTPDPDRTYYSRPQALHKITGKVCYHGDFWLKDGDGGHRKLGLTPLLSRFVLEMALKTWVPDYVFGFVPTTLSYKGIQARYGYTHCEPGVWLGPDNQVTDEDALVWMNTEEIMHFLEIQPGEMSHDRHNAAQSLMVRPIGVVA